MIYFLALNTCAGLFTLVTFIIWEIGAAVFVFSSSNQIQSLYPEQGNFCENALLTATRALLIIDYIFWSFAVILMCACCCTSAKTEEGTTENTREGDRNHPVVIIDEHTPNNRLPPISIVQVNKKRSTENETA